jgi:hypothetical protein
MDESELIADFERELVSSYKLFLDISSVIFGKNFVLSNTVPYMADMAFEIEISVRLKLVDIDAGIVKTDGLISEYLDTKPKKSCAISARFLMYAVESFQKREITNAFININQANKAILAAQNYFILERRTASQAKGGRKSKESRRELIAEYRQWAIDNSGKYTRQQAAYEISEILLKQHGISVGTKRIYEEWLKGL